MDAQTPEEIKNANIAKVATVTKDESVKIVKWFLEPMRSETLLILRLLSFLLRITIVLTLAMLIVFILLGYRLIFR